MNITVKNYNLTIPPSVLDRGNEIVLANMFGKKNLPCKNQIQNPLPEGTYVKTNRSLLCHCSIENGGTYIPPDIGACYKSPRMPTFECTRNIAFFNAYNEMRKKSNHTGQLKEALKQTTFTHCYMKANHVILFPHI